MKTLDTKQAEQAKKKYLSQIENNKGQVKRLDTRIAADQDEIRTLQARIKANQQSKLEIQKANKEINTMVQDLEKTIAKHSNPK